jgi:hypothetical protein
MQQKNQIDSLTSINVRLQDSLEVLHYLCSPYLHPNYNQIKINPVEYQNVIGYAELLDPDHKKNIKNLKAIGGLRLLVMSPVTSRYSSTLMAHSILNMLHKG